MRLINRISWPRFARRKPDTTSDFLQFQPDDIELEHSPPHFALRATLYTILGLFLFAITWASFAKIDRIVTAPGKLTTTSPRINVEPLETSVVRQVNIRPGQVVKEGALLITLDSTFTTADVSQVGDELESLKAQMERLRTELNNSDYEPNENASGLDATELQRIIHERRIAEYKSKEKYFTERKHAIEAAIRTNRDQLSKHEMQLRVLQEIEDMHTDSSVSKFTSKVDGLRARSDRLRVSTEIARLQTEADELKYELSSASSEHLTYIATWRKDIAEELMEVDREIKKLEQTLRKAERRKSLVDLYAAHDSVVLKMADISVGSVVQAAETLATLVPIDVPLEATVDIQTRDIGRVLIGDHARIKLEAFPFQKYGIIVGEVLRIAEDAIELNNEPRVPGESIYRAQLSLEENQLKNLPETTRLIPGMRVVAEIKVGQRRVIEYFLYPLIRALDESIREP